MSLLTVTSDKTFNIESDTIYTGAGTYILYTPPSGKRVLISDLIVSARDAGTFLILVGNTIKRRVFLTANGGWVENRTLPIEGNTDEAISIQMLTYPSGVTISISGECSKQ